MFDGLFCSSLSSLNALNTQKYSLVLWKQLNKSDMLQFQKHNKATCLVCHFEQKLHGVLTAK